MIISQTQLVIHSQQFLKDHLMSIRAGAVMIAGLESCWTSGLFITKKRYAINVLDLEGWQPEGG